MKRLNYNELSINQKVEVQVYYDGMTDCYYTGKITNKDGQNIVVEVETRDFSNDFQDMKQRDFETCNPDYAVVKEVK